MMPDGVLNMPDMSQEGIPEGFGVVPQGQPMQPPPQVAPGFLDHMGQFSRDNSAMLMAAAAGMGKGTPLGNMFGAIQEHQQYQDGLKAKKEALSYAQKQKEDQLAETKRLNSSKIDNYTSMALKNGTAKVTNMGNGFMAVIAPGQTSPTMIANEDFQQYENQTIDRKGGWNVLAAGLKSDSTPPSAAMEAHSLELRKAAETTDATVGRFESALNEIQTKGTPGLMGLPGLQAVGQIFGTDSSVVLRHLNELKVDAAFAGRAAGQGAISNFEREMLLSDVPAPTADFANWKEYIDARMVALRKVQAFARQEVERDANKPRNGLANAQALVAGGGPAAPPVAAPVAAPVVAAEPQQDHVSMADAGVQMTPAVQAALAIKQKTGDVKPLLAALNAQAQPKGLAAATAPKAAPAAGPATFNSAADVKAAIQAGKLKSGDVFLGPDGKQRKVN